MADDDLAALAAVIGEADRAFRSPSSPEYLARVILESEWLREHDARVRVAAITGADAAGVTKWQRDRVTGEWVATRHTVTVERHHDAADERSGRRP